MFRLRQFLRRGDTTGPELQPHRFDESERISRLVSERLAEDERLRGDLTDAGFGPVLNLVTSLVPAAAARATAGPDAANAEDAVSHAARGLARAMVDAASSGDVDGLSAALSEPILTADAAERARAAIANEQEWPNSPDERARRLTDIVRASAEEER